MLLICMVVTMALIMGATISKYGTTLLDSVGDKILDAAISLALPY